MLSERIVDNYPLSETKWHVDKRLTSNFSQRHLLTLREGMVRGGNKMKPIGSNWHDPQLLIVDICADEGGVDATRLDALDELSGASPRGLEAQLHGRVPTVKFASERRYIDQSKPA
ncbi:hypothetical protein GCM10023069_03120 [Shinella granuli]